MLTDFYKARNANNNNMVELSFSDKLLMFKKHYDDILRHNKERFMKKQWHCTKEQLAEAVPINIKVIYF